MKEETPQKSESTSSPEKKPLPEPSLTELMKGFAIQALVGLGESPSPITGKNEKDLDFDKYNIDMLQMIEDKTSGNLDIQEKNVLVQLLYDLRMRYVKAVNEK